MLKIISNYLIELNIEIDKNVELYVDIIPGVRKDADNKTIILLLMETNGVLNLVNAAKKALNENICDFVLTYKKEMLDFDKDRVIFFEPSCTWIDFENYKFNKKDFSISIVVGDKNFLEGHILRQKAWFKENKIKNKTNFFLSKHVRNLENYNNNKIIGDKKEPLFDSQFHICIENERKENMFTEKLIDCFLTKTIPIYYGCPNIGDFFDINGIIIVNSLKEIIDICNSVDENMYQKYLSYVNNNFEKSKKYINFNERLGNKILEII